MTTNNNDTTTHNDSDNNNNNNNNDSGGNGNGSGHSQGQGKYLEWECGHSGHILALYVETRGDFIICGDVMKSISLLRYGE